MTVEQNHNALLERQLTEALDEVASGRGDPLEVASLAGLLERTSPDSAALAAADAWLDSDGAQVLHDAFAVIDFDRLVDAAIDPDLDEDERWDGLSALEEACAAVTYGGEPARAVEPIDLAVRSINALPEYWTAFSERASRILEKAAPLGDDPSRALWRAIEAAQFFVEPLPEEANEERKELRRLAPPPALPAAAADILGADPLETPPYPVGPHATLVIQRTEREIRMILQVKGDVQRVEALRDGEPVNLEKRGRMFACPYLPGVYVFWIDGAPHRVEVG